MGKIGIKTKVSDKATAFWKVFIKKSPVFIVLSSLTVVSVLGLGVGGTLAATGVIPNPFASSTPDESSPEELEGSSDQGRPPMGDGTLPSDVGEWGAIGCVHSIDEQVDCPGELSPDESGKRGNILIQSGWTGVLYNFAGTGFYSHTLVDATVRGDLTTKLEINGRLAVSHTTHDCKPNEPRGHCRNMLNIAFNQRDFWVTYFGVCQAGGARYVVEASGAGYYFRESGIVPPQVFNCPPAEPTPSPTPESSSEPTSSPTPEPSQTPESSSEPTSSPTPTP
jgi:hypothetical protein